MFKITFSQINFQEGHSKGISIVRLRNERRREEPMRKDRKILFSAVVVLDSARGLQNAGHPLIFGQITAAECQKNSRSSWFSAAVLLQVSVS